MPTSRGLCTVCVERASGAGAAPTNWEPVIEAGSEPVPAEHTVRMAQMLDHSVVGSAFRSSREGGSQSLEMTVSDGVVVWAIW